MIQKVIPPPVIPGACPISLPDDKAVISSSLSKFPRAYDSVARLDDTRTPYPMPGSDGAAARTGERHYKQLASTKFGHHFPTPHSLIKKGREMNPGPGYIGTRVSIVGEEY